MNKSTLLFFLLIVLLFSSCATRKDLIYLRDMEELKEYPVFQKYEAVIHCTAPQKLDTKLLGCFL